MSDDTPHSSHGSSLTKNWFDKIGQIFAGEPKNKEELQDVFEDAAERELIDKDTKSMIEGVLDISEMRIKEIMVPRSEMVTIDVSLSVDEFLPTIIDSAHSRFPIISEDKDHVEGILLAKDLIQYGFKKDIQGLELKELIRKVYVVPESKRVDSMLKQFRDKRFHMAIVVDEFGGVSGLITIEDILEVIVGEIQDETDNEEAEALGIRKINERHYSVSARTDLSDFNQYFKSSFEDEDAETVAGLVMHSFGHLPERGECTEIDGFKFKVISADSRRILQLQITKPKIENSKHAKLES